ncbi:MAG: 50S ribosomal protein L11 methyltransferase [Actinomycetota bacterium]|nr:50S ribosomal protein L11 methyltransferase [Actinomycetota bacterium]
MLRLAVRVQRDQAELVLAELLELAPSGLEEVALGDTVVEYAVYGAPGELPSLPELKAAAAGALVEVSTTQVADDWAERWRSFHKPVTIARTLTVRAPWTDPAQTPVDLVIDPGQAFGTGSHPTTQLCLEVMLGLPSEGSFLDLGCGSGVLAIAAATLGWGPVMALDNESASIEAAAENVRRNSVQVEVLRGDLRRDAMPQARTVAANLLAPLLLDYARQLGPVPERLIAGGLLTTECEKVSGAFAARGLLESERRQSGEWAAILFARSDRG